MNRFLFLIISLTCFAATAHGLVVEFKPAAEVAEASITLGDIASFDEDTEFSRALATQPVGQAPSPGQQITLQSGPIAQYIAATIDPLTPVEWQGAASVVVTRHTLMVSSSDIMGIIDTHIQENAGRLAAAKIRFVPTAQPLPFSLPTGTLSWQVISSNPDVLQSSRFSVIFSIDGRVRKNMSVRGKMEVLTQVVVAARDLPRGTVLAPEHLAMATLDIAGQEEPVFDPQEIVGKKLLRSTHAGSTLSRHQVEFPSLIKKGQLVRIILKRGSLFLTATGVARNEGAVNDTIRVQNTESHKIVYCRVTAPGVVEVAL